MRPARHLAAILFTDIIGYTNMMNVNEVAATKVRERHREVFQREHARFNGEIIQYYGDGTLSTFKSAVEAVECAIKMQQEFQTGVEVPLRIGIHLGDIVFNESEVYGNGVNLASRIESLGVSGCILISENIQKAIKSHGSIETRSLGYFEFKNVSDPIEVFCIVNHGVRIPSRLELKGKIKEKAKSIAVLPFVNMSPDPENEYFSDGITEEILNALVKVEGLHVTARTSSFAFKGKNLDIREIGRQLGVQHILEGSVRKAGNKVRITAQLVSCVDGYHFFSETYDRDLEDIFAVQDEIALKITNRLRQHLSEIQHEKQLVKAPTVNIQAYEIYLKGLYFFNQWGEAMAKAIPYFHQAAEMDENFILPHVRLGVCYYFQGFSRTMSWKDAKEKAIYHFVKCQEQHPESPETYFALFVYHFFIRWDWLSAAEITREGLDRFPNFSSLYHCLSTLYWIKGDTSNLIRAHLKGLQLDPISIEMNLYMGVAYIWGEDYDKALYYIEKVLEMVPNHRTAHEYKGWIAAFQGQYEKALEIFEKLEPIGYRLHRSTCLGWVYTMQRRTKAAKVCLKELLNLESDSTQGIGFTVDLAVLYTCMNNFEKAFENLEKAINNRIGSIMMCKADPFLKPLETDPRFTRIEKLIGQLPDIDF